jgi:hypothetical protein
MFKRYHEVVDIPIDASASYVFTADKFSSVDPLYTISTWIYVDDWNTNFGVFKNILSFERKGTKSTEFNLDKYENNLLVNYEVYSQPNSNTTTTQTVKIPNINIQKWVNITVCFNTNNTDTYINGKLIDTDIHQNPIFSPDSKETSKGNFILADKTGFSGKIYLIVRPHDLANIELLKQKYTNVISLIDDIDIIPIMHINNRRFFVQQKYINIISFESDYLLEVFDENRMGGLRFKLNPDGEFLNNNKKFKIDLNKIIIYNI